MTTTTPAPVARNGVDVPTLLATREAVRAQPALADDMRRQAVAMYASHPLDAARCAV